MTEKLDIVINANTDRAREGVTKLIEAFKRTESALSKLRTLIAKTVTSNNNLSTSFEKTAQSAAGIVDVNGKIIQSFKGVDNAIAKQTELNIGLVNTISKVLGEFRNTALVLETDVVGAYKKASIAAKQFTQETIKIVPTIRAVAKETQSLGINIAGNVVSNYAKANVASKQFDSSLTRLSQTISKVRNDTRMLGVETDANLIRNFAKTNQVAQAAIQPIGRLGKEYQVLRANILKTSSAVDKMRNLNTMQRWFNSASRGAKSFVGNLRIAETVMRAFSIAIVYSGYSILRWLKNTGDVASNFLGFRNAIQVATGSLENANNQMQFAIGVAREFKIDVTSTTKAYSKFVNAVALSADPTKSMTENIAEANEQFRALAQVGRVLNLSKQALSGMFLAIEQMASKGFVSLEELRRQLGEHLPGAVSLAAKSWGRYLERTISVAEFMKMVEKRTVETSKFLKVFTEDLKEMTQPLVAQSLLKSSAAFDDLNTSITLLAAAMGTFFQPVFVAFANSMNAIVKVMIRMFPVSEHLISSLEKKVEVYEKLSTSTQTFSSEIAEATDQIERLKKELKEPTDLMEYFAENTGMASVALIGMTGAAGGALTAIRLLGIGIYKWIITPIITVLGYAKRIAAFLLILARLHPVISIITAVGTAIYFMKDKIADAISVFPGFSKGAKTATVALKELNEEVEETRLDKLKFAFDDALKVKDPTGFVALTSKIEYQSEALKINEINLQKSLATYKAMINTMNNSGVEQSKFTEVLSIQNKEIQKWANAVNLSRKNLLALNDALQLSQASQNKSFTLFNQTKEALEEEIKKLRLGNIEYERRQNLLAGMPQYQANEIAMLRKKVELMKEENRETKKKNDSEIQTIIPSTPVDIQHQKYLDNLNKQKDSLDQSLMTELEIQNAYFIKQTNLLNEWHSRNIGSKVEYYTTLQKLTEQHAKRVKDIQEQGIKEQNQFAIQAARTIQSIFADFLFDPFEDGLKGMFDSTVTMMRKIAAQIAAQQLLMSGANFLQGAGAGSWLGGAVGDFLSGLGARADGGPVAANVPYIVGEREPEIFVPKRPGTVVPSSEIGQKIVQTLNFNIGGSVDNRSLQQIQTSVAVATSVASRRNT